MKLVSGDYGSSEQREKNNPTDSFYVPFSFNSVETHQPLGAFKRFGVQPHCTCRYIVARIKQNKKESFYRLRRVTGGLTFVFYNA